jgi:class 3 adenylate cyclase/CheY-like chemotaxis protein
VSAEPTRSPLTLLFSDVERSTEIVERHGSVGTDALLRHHEIVREAVEREGGHLFERIGDAAYAAYRDPVAALRSAVEIHERLAAADWGPVGRLRVRIGLDTGDLQYRDGRYLGRTLYRCARIQGLASGGETHLSGPTAAQVRDALPEGYRLRDLGEQRLRGLRGSEHVWALVAAPTTTERPIRVLLVDDYEVVRRGLRSLIELQPDMEVVGEASNGHEALEAANRLEPDVVLMDLVMPPPDGVAVIGTLHDEQPGIAAVALTSFTEPERIQRAIDAGAAGHLMKDAEGDEVLAAIRAAYRGGTS